MRTLIIIESSRIGFGVGYVNLGSYINLGNSAGN